MLLDQAGAHTLTAVPGNTETNTPPSVTVGTQNAPVTLTEADGAIGSSLTAWEAGATAMQGLNTLASVFSSTINTSQAEGLTSSGLQGSALFSVPPPSVTASTSNTGGAAMTAAITNAAQLPTDGGPFVLTYSSATASWNAVDQTTGTSYQSQTSGTPPVTTIAGMTLNVTGTPANGDQFTINPAPDAATGLTLLGTSAERHRRCRPLCRDPRHAARRWLGRQQ